MNGLSLSILCGNSFYFLYQQTESIYAALYAEVTEAKSLLEQVAYEEISPPTRAIYDPPHKVSFSLSL